MKKLIIGICDDEEIILKILHSLVSQVVRKMGLEFEILAFSSGESVLLKAKELEIVFLDIDMPGMDGIEVGRRLHFIHPECKVIMATCIVERFKEAFWINAFRFVTKPFEEIEEAIGACVSQWVGFGTIEAYLNRNLYQIQQRDICYVLAYGSWVELEIKGKRFRKDISMEKAELILDANIFCRVHRKYLINLFWVETYKEGIVTLAGQEIPVARRKKKEFEHIYLEFDLKYGRR